MPTAKTAPPVALSKACGSELESVRPSAMSTSRSARTGHFSGFSQLVTQVVSTQIHQIAAVSTTVSTQADRARLLEEQLRELREGEDEDDIEEHLDEGDAMSGLAVFGAEHAGSGSAIVDGLHIAQATGPHPFPRMTDAAATLFGSQLAFGWVTIGER